MANSVDQDQMPQNGDYSAASDLGPHCLLRLSALYSTSDAFFNQTNTDDFLISP